VAASAQDNIGVARVEFYSDYNVLIGSDTTAPYSVDWDTTPLSNGIHNVRIRIYDAAGNSTTLDSSFWIYNAKANEATLSVTATGRLGPVITSNPTGIYAHANMPGSATFLLGTQITLRVDSSRTAIWSGACSSSGAKRSSCTFTFTGNSVLKIVTGGAPAISLIGRNDQPSKGHTMAYETVNVDGYDISMSFDSRVIHIRNDANLSNLLSNQSAASRQVARRAKEVYKLRRSKDFNVSAESIAVEVLGHVYPQRMAQAVAKVAPFLKDKVGRILQRTDPIDIGEWGVDGNRLVWDLLAPMAWLVFNAFDALKAMAA
jgi:hypothetical protein